MTLEKAIEILMLTPLPIKTASDHDYHQAVYLAIHALIRLQAMRNCPILWACQPLHGEAHA